ncbi:MAG: tetratricopeptide repeat protein [Bacteroidetes bacterium]|nr:tetratricopeptide repeat protein [Bacteroidota bacterium]
MKKSKNKQFTTGRQKVSPPLQPPADLHRRYWIYCLAIAVITLITFIPSLQNEFVDTWDDQGYVIDNPQITGLSFNKIKEIFTSDIWGNYNPLTILTFGVERYFFGSGPFIYHLDNLLLHIICTVLVFRLTHLLIPSLIPACVISLLFGIHPLHVESVAWVTERKDVLFGVFYLLSLIVYIKYARTGKNRYYFFTAAFFLLSLFSKIQAVSLPLSLLCIDYFLGRPLRGKTIYEKIPLLALSVIFGLIGIHFLKEMKAFYVSSEFTLTDRPFIGTYGLTIYIIKSLIPFKLAAYYPYPEKENGFLPIAWYASFLVAPVLLYILWKTYRKVKFVFFGLLFFLFNIVFLLQILEAGGAFLADRFSYVSFYGLFFIVGNYAGKFYGKFPRIKIVLISTASAYFIILAVISWNRCKIWKNSLTFWNDEIAKYPAVSFSYTNRAGVFIKMDRLDKAVEDFTSYIALRPMNPEGYYKRGIVFNEMKNSEAALNDFSSAIKINSSYFDAYFHRSGILTDAGRYEEALADCDKMLSLNPDAPEAWNSRGSVHFRQGKFTDALEDINKTISLDPAYKDAFRNRAILFDMLGLPERAVIDFDSHLKLYPQDNEARTWRENVAGKIAAGGGK